MKEQVKARTEMLQILQRRMAQRSRGPSGMQCRWTDKEFADLCRLFIHWYRKE